MTLIVIETAFMRAVRYEKQEMLSGLLELQFETDSDLIFHRDALAYVTSRASVGIGTAAQHLSYGDNGRNFFTFLDDFDIEMMPEWRDNAKKLKELVGRLNKY